MDLSKNSNLDSKDKNSSNTNSFMDELLCCIYNNAYGDSFSSKFKTGSCVSTETDIIETTFKEID